MQPHLTDEALNEYLDEALPADQRAEAAAHLAHCDSCTARLDALRVLFTGLAALPEVPLTRDLAPAVLKALPAHAPLPVRTRRPAVPWLLAAEGVAAVLVLALAWPLLTSYVATLPSPAELSVSFSGWLVQLAALTPTTWAPPAWLAQAQSWWQSLWPSVTLAPNTLTPLLVSLAVTGAAALWLVGNALLLRRSLVSRLRRRA